MAPRIIRKAIGLVKDQTSIGLARVSSSTSLSRLHVAIVKATRHDEHPTEDRYVREILILTGRSRSHVAACVAALSRRLGRTRSWAVALKTLALVHRLVAEGDPAYEEQVFRATLMLDVSAASRDLSAFVRALARYLDECVERRVRGRRVGRKQKVGVVTEEAGEMKAERLFVRMEHLQKLLDRFLACRPTGAAKKSRLVAMALYPIVKESYQLYFDLTEIISTFVDRFMTLQVPDCVHVRDIFTRLSKQLDELDLFYNWCKPAGISRPSEFPDVEGISPKQLEVMDEFIQKRSAMVHGKKLESSEPMRDSPKEPMPDEGSDCKMTEIKALPLPEEENTGVEESSDSNIKAAVEQEVDLLNLKDETMMTGEEHGVKLALALFDCNPAAPTGSPTWESLMDSSDWETALIQSASNLSGQKAALGGGLDMLLLDGMYNQAAAGTGVANGSASSMAVGTAAQGLLALPVPAMAGGGGDPFAASLAVPPPAWVQMVEMERKQGMLVEEQRMWQQYMQEGMQGRVGMAKLQPGTYPMGLYNQML